MARTGSTYAQPTNALQVPSVSPRPLKRILPPSCSWKTPETLAKLAKLTESRPCSYEGTFLRTTHVVPAATTRLLATGTIPKAAPEESKEARKERMKEITKVILEKKKASERGEMVEGLLEEASQPQLFNVLDRYRPVEQMGKPSVNGLTLLLIHATGFPRRIWEPTLKHLYQLASSETHPLRIEEVWSIEAVNHGDGALLNAEGLGNLFEWADMSRDIINFLLHYLPDEAVDDLPGLLTPVPEAESRLRRHKGFRYRTLVGMGHSFGGCSLARAAVEVPALWSTLFLVDPIILPALRSDVTGGIDRLTAGAVSRKTNWPSRAAAQEQFLKSPFFQSWDHDALDAYVKEGLTETRDGVALKISGFLEGITFAERRLVTEMWELLPALDERISLHWAMSGRPPIPTGPEEITQQTVWRRPANSSNVRIEGAGHLIVQEAPAALAHDVYNYMLNKYGTPRSRL